MFVRIWDDVVGGGRGEGGVVLEGREGLDVRKWDDGCRKKHAYILGPQINFTFSLRPLNSLLTILKDIPYWR